MIEIQNMRLEIIKRKFIEYMEKVHGANMYPRNFFGCLLSIVIEPNPVSQERIMELTGYSQATVSVTIQKIQFLMPIRVLKKLGDRRNYYSYEGPPEGFLLDLLQRRVDIQDIDILLIESMLEKVREIAAGNSKLKRFQDYLKNMRLFQTLIHLLRSDGVEPFKRFLETGNYDDQGIRDVNALKKGALVDFLSKLKLSILNNDTTYTYKDDSPDISLPLKNEYYVGIKTTLNPLYSQSLANRIIVMHSVLLEGCTTQEWIEKSTLLPRSTISEILGQLVKRGIIKFIRKKGSRTKIYQPTISLAELMLSSVDRIVQYESDVMMQLSEYISMTRKIRPVNTETRIFLNLLRKLKKAFSFAQQFSKSMKVGLVIKLKDEYENGFVFV
jgi:DNA-binding transcriptional regulator GbsR (MarR family)